MDECVRGSRLSMYPTPNAGTPKALRTAFWTVDDVEAEVAEAKGPGVVFEERHMPGFEDGQQHRDGGRRLNGPGSKTPEGNILAVSQRLRFVA